ncbi:MAG: Gfo/Idh/MocA family oxidoreductase [Acidobacteria bacterium]|nr:Gfo/Idh/MocA family oxidoreductase [Acidobacteriota bacterium]
MLGTTTRRSLLTAASAMRILGANDRPKLGIVGTGGRGQYLMRALNKMQDQDWVAVCDIYDARREQAEKITGRSVAKYGDHRRLLEHKEIDAVIVATPDHWHAPVAIDALRAGKDVYVEKPMVHTPKDGMALVKAVRETGRVLQVGMQGRGLQQFVVPKERYIDSGVMGKVGMARTWYLSNSGYVQEPPPGMEQKPAGLDWDRWLGPGPKVPWNPNIYFSPYKWLHYDGGMIMGIAIHVVDSAHHWLGLKSPAAAVAGGSTFFYNDGRDTPDVVSFILEYPNKATVTFHAECLSAPGVKTSAGVEARGTGGVLHSERYETQKSWSYAPNGKFSKEAAAGGDGVPATADVVLKDWMSCIQTRQKPIANVEEGYYSSMACFMANQAYQKKTRIVWDAAWNI